MELFLLGGAIIRTTLYFSTNHRPASKISTNQKRRLRRSALPNQNKSAWISDDDFLTVDSVAKLDFFGHVKSYPNK